MLRRGVVVRRRVIESDCLLHGRIYHLTHGARRPRQTIEFLHGTKRFRRDTCSEKNCCEPRRATCSNNTRDIVYRGKTCTVFHYRFDGGRPAARSIYLFICTPARAVGVLTAFSARIASCLSRAKTLYDTRSSRERGQRRSFRKSHTYPRPTSLFRARPYP